MTEITATQFKARCLRLLDEVAESGEPLVITKYGRPVARLEPVGEPADLRGSATTDLTDEELIYFTMGEWDIERE
jgi:prevent-host-death family protein